MAIELIDKIKPKGGGNFPMVEAQDVDVGDGQRLSGVLPTRLGDVNGAAIPITLLSEAQYAAMQSAGTLDLNRLYLLYEDETP